MRAGLFATGDILPKWKFKVVILLKLKIKDFQVAVLELGMVQFLSILAKCYGTKDRYLKDRYQI